MTAADSSFLSYYLKELSSLEDGFVEFAESFPQVAGNLGLGREGGTDPHLRQLIESIAFIAARLKRQIDDVPGELARGLLHAAAPHLAASVPSMSVVKFSPMSDQLDAKGETLPGTLRMRAVSTAGECVFTGCSSDVKLWPLTIEACVGRIDSMSAHSKSNPIPSDCEEFLLMVRHPKKKIPQQAPGDLTFFISGPLNRALAAIDALKLGLVEIAMTALDGSWTIPLRQDQVQVLGFESAHRLIPAARTTQHSGPLAIEFLSFPRRFCFVKVSGLHCPAPVSGFVLKFIIKRPWIAALDAVKAHIHLNCIPVINLYERPLSAIPLIDVWNEHTLPRSDAGQGSWDVHAVNRVQLVDNEKRSVIPEFHTGVDANSLHREKKIFWQGVWRERANSNIGHASVVLRFVGLEHLQSSVVDGVGMALVESTGTNCDAPERLPAGQELELTGWDGGYHAKLEFVPTAYVAPISPSNATASNLLRLLQSRSGLADNVCASVHQYLSAHNKVPSAYAAAAVLALLDIKRELIAMPWPEMPMGAMIGMGCQYFLSFRKDGELPGSRYLLARLVKQVLTQVHGSSLPLVVLAEGSFGEALSVN